MRRSSTASCRRSPSSASPTGGVPIVEGPGERYFDESLRGGRSPANRFALLVGAGDNSSTAADARRLADDFRDVIELRLGPGQGIMLVCPDGYLAYASRGGVTSSTLGSVREVLERQTVSST